MKVLALGHSAYVLEMAVRGATRTVRILADPWLSDYVVGDLCGRFPRLRFATSALGAVDAVWISHSHTDHFDPYTLLRLWRELSPRPALLLPQSLRYLEGLVREHLAGVEVVFLEDRRSVDFRGLELMAFFNPETRPTNEDDVMVLTARNGQEAFLAESDALLPFYDAETRAFVTSLLCAQGVETAVFLTTKNELEASMAAVGARDAADRKQRVGRSLERLYDELEEIYAPVDEEAEADEAGEADLWGDKRLVRLIGGQGICFPQQLGGAWNRILFPIRVEDRVCMEREVAEQHGHAHAVEELRAGEAHVVEGGKLVGREPVAGIELLDREEDRRYEPKTKPPPPFAMAPLAEDERDEARQRAKILTCLNTRLLPHLIGARTPPVEHLLGAGGGEYRIRVRFGTPSRHADADFRLAFDRLVFTEAAALGEASERYWANDLEDFLDGRADEFSTFCRTPLGAPEQRLWLTLGLPYLNNDLVERKLRFHFERAARGEPLADWVLGFHAPA